MSDNEQTANPNTQQPTTNVPEASVFVHVERPKTGKPDSFWIVFNDDVTGNISNGPNAQNPFRRVYRVLVRPKTDQDRARDAEYAKRRAEGGNQPYQPQQRQGGYGRGQGYGRQGYGQQREPEKFY